jgi:hypothetical protein
MVLRQRDELNAAPGVVDFQSSHFARSLQCSVFNVPSSVSGFSEYSLQRPRSTLQVPGLTAPDTVGSRQRLNTENRPLNTESWSAATYRSASWAITLKS